MIQRTADDLGADVLRYRHRFAGHHGFVHGAAAFQQPAVDRHFFPRPHAQAVAHLDHVERDFFVRAASGHTPSGLWCQTEQGTNRAAGFFARPQLQNLTEENKHGDDRCRLEIDRDLAVFAAQFGGEDARHQRRDNAIEPRDPGPHGDQGEHVEIARDDGGPPAREQRPAHGKHHRRCERKLNPVHGSGAQQLG